MLVKDPAAPWVWVSVLDIMQWEVLPSHPVWCTQSASLYGHLGLKVDSSPVPALAHAVVQRSLLVDQVKEFCKMRGHRNATELLEELLLLGCMKFGTDANSPGGCC